MFNEDAWCLFIKTHMPRVYIVYRCAYRYVCRCVHSGVTGAQWRHKSLPGILCPTCLLQSDSKPTLSWIRLHSWPLVLCLRKAAGQVPARVGSVRRGILPSYTFISVSQGRKKKTDSNHPRKKKITYSITVYPYLAKSLHLLLISYPTYLLSSKSPY